jgi:hypothetical protein
VQGWNIELVFLVPHSSDQTQPLDVITFAVLKGHFASARVARVNTAQSRKIVRMLGSFYAATAPHQVVEAFMSMGLIPEERGGEMYLTAKMQGARRVRPHPFFSSTPLAELPSDARRRVSAANWRVTAEPPRTLVCAFVCPYRQSVAPGLCQPEMLNLTERPGKSDGSLPRH